MRSEQTRVLLVENDPVSAQLLAQRLTLARFRVFVTVDGEQALEQTWRLQPDLIIMNSQLPHIDGVIVSRTLKRSRQFQHIPIILLTDQPPLRAVDADVVLIKPFRTETLLDRVQAMLTTQPPIPPPGVRPQAGALNPSAAPRRASGTPHTGGGTIPPPDDRPQAVPQEIQP